MRLSLGVVVLLLAPSASAEPWLQFGYDAARTGATGDAGPARFDIAFHLELDARWEPRAPPLLVDREALLLTTVEERSTLQAIDLDTTRTSARVSLDERATTVASDGRLLFLARTTDVAAYPLAGGEPVWTAPFPDLIVAAERRTFCVEPAVREDVLYLACTQLALSRDGPMPPLFFRARPETGAGHAFAWALDARTGDPLWLWDPRDDAARPYGDVFERDPWPTGGSQATIAGSLSVIGPVATVVLLDGEASGRGGPPSVWALDAATGEYRWMFSQVRDHAQRVTDAFADPVDASPRQDLLPSGVAPTGTPESVFLKFGTLLWSLSAESGQREWVADLREGPAAGAGSSLAAAGGSVFAGSLQSVYRVDARTQTVLWRTPLQETPETRLVVAGGHVYVRTWDRVFSVLDVDDGAIVWRLKEGPGEPGGGDATVSVGEGVALFVTLGTNLTVVGSTAASPVPEVRTTSVYPAAGSAFTVDLSGSAPGVLGAPTEFRADWGDGSVTEWQTSPVLTHAYDGVGDHLATFSVRNDAGQTASRTLVVHAGQTPETFLQAAFSAQNQERTFFLLGLLVTLAAALVGVARLQRRRARLQHELRALDTAYAATRARPLDCEAALAERRAHARGMLLDGKLDEGQLAVLERRIDELSTALRVEAIDERFGFLSVSMARTLREMLADGRVQRWEREHLLVALERDPYLTPDQKAMVRRQVEDWSVQDAGAPV